jgi:hypothetical protein
MMSFDTLEAERIGTVVSGDGELLQLVRKPADLPHMDDITVQGPRHEIVVPGYALRDLGHGNYETGVNALVDLIERSDLTDSEQPLYAQFAQL